MGFFDDIFGGFFDLNGDGKTSLDEEWLTFQIIDDINKTHDKDDDSSDESEDAYAWRELCEDASDLNIDPEDYETEEEYCDELNEAFDESSLCYTPSITIPIKLSFSFESPVDDKLDAIKMEDYPNKRQYEAAYTLATECMEYTDKETDQKRMVRAKCHFILEQSSKVIAANYLTVNNGFLYTQAVKDHFTLPVKLPDEDEEQNTLFRNMLRKIARKDIELCLKIWDWCIEQFMPYAHFEWWAEETLTCETMDDLYGFPKAFKSELVRYLGEHPAFCHALFRDAPELANGTPDFIYIALQSGSADIAKLIFEDSLINANEDSDALYGIIHSVILCCNNGNELESMEIFQLQLFPLVLKYAGDELEDEIGDWKNEMAEYIGMIERNHIKYAYSRCNSWRKSAPDGKKYGLNVCNYKTEHEYLAQLDEIKYGWRRRYRKDDCFGLNPSDYETQEEFSAALYKQRVRADDINSEQRHYNQNKEDPASPPNQTGSSVSDDKNVYIYCGVVFGESSNVYHYRTEDSTIKIGDSVIVPVGCDSNEKEASIVCVGQYTRLSVPFPVEKTRFIIRKE